MKNLIFLSLSILFTAGCINIRENRKKAGITRQSLFLKETGKKKERTTDGTLQTTLFWAHYDATQRGGVYLVTGDGQVKIVSENPPDVAITNSIDAVANIKAADNTTVEAKLSTIQSLSELGQRNAANYMIRDIAFRIEALSNNSETIDPEILELYKNLIASAEKISIAMAESDAAAKIAETERLQVIQELILLSKDTNYSHLNLDAEFFKSIIK